MESFFPIEQWQVKNFPIKYLIRNIIVHKKGCFSKLSAWMNFPCQDHLTAGLILTIQACTFSSRNVIRWKTESFPIYFLKGIICQLPEMLLLLFLCNYSLTGSLSICQKKDIRDKDVKLVILVSTRLKPMLHFKVKRWADESFYQYV